VGSGSAARVWPEVTAKSLDEDELVATTGPTNLQVCRHGPRHFAHQPLAAKSLKGISPIAWGCYSAALATPGHRPPRTTQLGRSWLRNPVGGQKQHRHTGHKRSVLRGGAGGQRPDEGDHPPLHPPRSVLVRLFREGEAPSEPVRWACAVRTSSRWAASAVETPSRLSRPPRNTASPSSPSAPQTTLSATAQTAACAVPRTVAFGNEGLQCGCCDRGCGQLETHWPIFQCHRKPLEENVLWHLMWVHKQRVVPNGPCVRCGPRTSHDWKPSPPSQSQSGHFASSSLQLRLALECFTIHAAKCQGTDKRPFSRQCCVADAASGKPLRKREILCEMCGKEGAWS
jgi:hypothetical protein